MISSGWMQEMEPIPEEGTEADGSEWGAMSDTAKRTMRKKEVYTSEQINTLVSFNYEYSKKKLFQDVVEFSSSFLVNCYFV
nr:hypothetical protein Y105C5B.v - Caenorhabditis elegans [Caenorhabditis elegans]